MTSYYQVGDQTCYSCSNTNLVPSSYQDEFDFICTSAGEGANYNPFVLVFAVFGVILLSLMFCVCIIVLRLKGIICRGRYLRNLEREMEERAQQQE